MPLALKQMSAAFGFGQQVAAIVLVRRKHVRHALAHLDPMAGQRAHLGGVVCQQTHPGDIELSQHLHGGQIDALIIVKAQLFVGIDGVKTKILQSIGAQFIDQSNPAPFLRQIQKYPCALFCDGRG